MENSNGGISATLCAAYHSPSGDKVFRQSIAVPQPAQGAASDTQTKTRYLSELRSSTRILQEEVNKFLTDKMEEDKKSSGPEDRTGVAKQKADDELEEEHYGEEEVEDES